MIFAVSSTPQGRSVDPVAASSALKAAHKRGLSGSDSDSVHVTQSPLEDPFLGAFGSQYAEIKQCREALDEHAAAGMDASNYAQQGYGTYSGADSFDYNAYPSQMYSQGLMMPPSHATFDQVVSEAAMREMAMDTFNQGPGLSMTAAQQVVHGFIRSPPESPTAPFSAMKAPTHRPFADSFKLEPITQSAIDSHDFHHDGYINLSQVAAMPTAPAHRQQHSFSSDNDSYQMHDDIVDEDAFVDPNYPYGH